MSYLNDINFTQDLRNKQTFFNDLYNKKMQEEFDEINNQKNFKKKNHLFKKFKKFFYRR